MKHKIAVFPGDGVGPELIKEGMKIIDKAAELDKFEIEWLQFNGPSEKILKEIKDKCNSIYCGALENSRLTRNLIRNFFEQFISLRPIKLLPNVEGPLAGKTSSEIDFTIIRENTEDFYAGASGRAKNGRSRQQIELNKSTVKAKIGLSIETKGNEIAYQIGVLSRKGCERVIQFGFEHARSRNSKKITFVDKANVMDYYNFWRESVDRIAKEHQGAAYEFELIDAAVMNLVRQPEAYSIIVAPNMFGDILSDLGTAIQGGLAFAAQGNINPEGISMFEPIHGPAPKLKDSGIVNPIATIWAGSLMLDAIGQHKPGSLIIKAIESVLKEGRARTQDLGGNNTTSEMGDAILDKLIELHD